MPNHKKFKKKPLTLKQRKNLSKAMKGNKNAVGADSGRPSEYTSKIGKAVYAMLLSMRPVTEIMKILGIPRETYYRWEREIPEFREYIFQGTYGVDDKVVHSLKKKAAGFKVRVEKPIKVKDDETGADKIINHKYVEYYPPDTRAQELWLRNRSNLKKDWSNTPPEDAPPPPIPTNVMNQIDWSKVDDATIRKLIAAIKPPDTKS
jgi:hypothetical protein